MNSFETRLLDNAASFKRIARAADASGVVSNFEFFGYSVMFGQDGIGDTPIAPGDNRQAVIPIQSDSDFVWSYLSYGVQPAVNGNIFPSPSIRLQINDTGQGTDIYSEPMPGMFVAGEVTSAVADNAGAGGFTGVPFALVVPRIVQRNTNIKINIVNTNAALGASIHRYFLTLIGTRVYSVG